jgi:hypothetical protein
MGIGPLRDGIKVLFTDTVEVVMAKETAVRRDADKRFAMHDV